MNDQEIIELFENRNQDALSAVNESYGIQCKNVIHRILYDDRDVQECLNDTWLALWKLIPPNHPNPFMPYIIRIAKNQALKKLEYNQAVKRNSYYDCTLEELENHVVSLTSVENALEEEALKTFINQFLAKQRERKIDTELISDCLMDEICFKDEDHILVPGDTYMIDDAEYTGENLINLNSMCVEESYKKYGEIKLRWNYDFENDTLTITDITDDQTFSMKGLSEDYYLAEIQGNYALFMDSNENGPTYLVDMVRKKYKAITFPVELYSSPNMHLMNDKKNMLFYYEGTAYVVDLADF